MTVSADRRIRNETLVTVRLAMNMSQTEFARAIRDAGDKLGDRNACTKRLVQKWESGEHTVCRPHYRRALESATRMHYSELGFADSAKGDASGSSITSPLDSAQGSAQSTALIGDTADRLRYALARPEVATVEAVDLMAQSTAHLFALENHQPARVMLPMVAAHIREVAAMLSGAQRVSLRERLTIAGGQSAALAGWLALDLGGVSTAHHYWDTALACARNATHAPLFACVLTNMSYSAEERGDPNTAWQLAHEAVSHAGDNPRALAWTAVRAAQTAAQLGDAGAALAELEPALDLVRDLDPAAPEDDAEPWCRFVDRAYIYAMAANAYGQLGDTDNAYKSAVRALDSLSTGQTRTRVLVLTEAAHAFTRIGGTARAAQWIDGARRLAGKLEFTHALRRLQALALPESASPSSLHLGVPVRQTVPSRAHSM